MIPPSIAAYSSRGPAMTVKLALVGALEKDAGLKTRLGKALRAAGPDTAQAERRVLEAALRDGSAPEKPRAVEVAPGIRLEARKGRVTLSGRNEARRVWSAS